MKDYVDNKKQLPNIKKLSVNWYVKTNDKVMIEFLQKWCPDRLEEFHLFFSVNPDENTTYWFSSEWVRAILKNVTKSVMIIDLQQLTFTAAALQDVVYMCRNWEKLTLFNWCMVITTIPDFDLLMQEWDTFTMKTFEIGQERNFQYPIEDQSLKNVIKGLQQSNCTSSLDKTKGIFRWAYMVEEENANNPANCGILTRLSRIFW